MVRHDHFPLVHPASPDDREYQVEFAAEIQALARQPEGREQYRLMFERIENALGTKVRELEAAGSPFGVHEVFGAGRITIVPRDPDFAGRSATLSFSSEATQEERARRLLPHLQDAAKKFCLWPDRDGHIAVAVIDMPMGYSPSALHQLLAADLRTNEALYRETDAVVCREVAWHIDPEGDPWKTYQHFACFVMRLQWCKMPIENLVELSRILLSSQHRLLAPARRRDRDDLVPSVIASTQVWTCTI